MHIVMFLGLLESSNIFILDEYKSPSTYRDHHLKRLLLIERMFSL